MKPIVVIPALYPDGKLISLVNELKEQGMHTVVVDDGSGKDYAELFQQLKADYHCDLCIHPANRGKGVALKTATAYIREHYPDCPGFVTADADGQHAVASIKKVADNLLHNPEALILGTRNFEDREIPFRSRFGNAATSCVFRLATGITCKDTQTGLRGIPMLYAERCLAISGDRYEYEMNQLMSFAKNKIPMIQVPIQTIYIENNRASHFNPVKDSCRIYFNILKYSLSSMISSTIDLFFFWLFSSYLVAAHSAKIVVATVLARALSGIFNFLLNKHWVFQSSHQSGSQAFKYACLFFSQMFLSGLFVSLLSGLPIPLLIVKISVDTALFFASYTIQKNYIFKVAKKGQYNL